MTADILIYDITFKVMIYIIQICFIAVSQPPQYLPSPDACASSPCGLYAECRNVGGAPSCACKSSYIGSPPNCRPECTINSECPSNQACINEICRDPCPGACGLNAICTVFKHVAQCGCLGQYTGDPFTQCQPIPDNGNLILKYTYFKNVLMQLITYVRT